MKERKRKEKQKKETAKDAIFLEFVIQHVKTGVKFSFSLTFCCIQPRAD